MPYFVRGLSGRTGRRPMNNIPKRRTKRCSGIFLYYYILLQDNNYFSHFVLSLYIFFFFKVENPLIAGEPDCFSLYFLFVSDNGHNRLLKSRLCRWATHRLREGMSRRCPPTGRKGYSDCRGHIIRFFASGIFIGYRYFVDMLFFRFPDFFFNGFCFILLA